MLARTHLLQALFIASLCAPLALGCGDASSSGGGQWDGLSGAGGAGGDNGGGSADNGGGGGTGGSSGGSGSGSSSSGGSTGSSSGGSSSGGTKSDPSFAVALNNATLSSELMMSAQVTVSVTPQNGFTGQVALSATGFPTGVTATFNPASVNITGTDAVTSVMTVKTPSSATPFATAMNIPVTGTAGSVSANAPLAYSIKRQITIVIPQNAEQSSSSFGTSPIVINTGGITTQNPLKLYFLNKDSSKDHEVHSSNTTNGFFHGQNTIPLNGMELRTITGTGNYPFYMHGENQAIGNSVKIN